MNRITIGYLSWKRHNILNQTLNSHKLNGLFDIINTNNRNIFFQELSVEDKNIANNLKEVQTGFLYHYLFTSCTTLSMHL